MPYTCCCCSTHTVCHKSGRVLCNCWWQILYVGQALCISASRQQVTSLDGRMLETWRTKYRPAAGTVCGSWTAISVPGSDGEFILSRDTEPINIHVVWRTSWSLMAVEIKWWQQQVCSVRMKTIRQRQLNFLGHVMRRHGLENLAVTGKVDGRRGRGRQRLKYLF